MDCNEALNQAYESYKSGNIGAASQILAQILNADIDNEWAWYLLSHCLQESRDIVFTLRQVLRINPQNERAINRLTSLEGKQTLLTFQPEKKYVPDADLSREDREAILSEARVLIDSCASEEARSVLRELLREDGDCAQAWILLSEAATSLREKQVYLNQAFRINPNLVQTKPDLEVLPAKKERYGAIEAEGLSTATKKRAFFDFGKYTVKKAIILFLTVVVGLYATILIANMGGYVDKIFEGMIADQMMAYGFGANRLPEEQLEQIQWQLEENMGLHDPFLLRTIRWLLHGLTLNYGEPQYNYGFFSMVWGRGDENVRKLVFQRLPFTLILVGASNLLVFLASISAALVLSRKYGSLMDRVSATLASLSSAPSWVFGVILLVFAASRYSILLPKQIDLQFADFSPEFLKLVLRQMILPVIAIFLSIFFQGVYAWRTFFLIYSQEDYVDMARAVGLSARKIERQYILRPTFPYVITSFAMMMITVWESSIALELLFYWPGIGPLFLSAAGRFDTSLIVGIVVVFAYLLATTVFVLDLVYGMVDPRVRVGQNGQNIQAARKKEPLFSKIKRTLLETGEVMTGLASSIRTIPASFKVPLSQRIHSFKRVFQPIIITIREVRKYPSAILGLGVIVMLVFLSIYAVMAIPYQEAVNLWRPHNTNEATITWEKTPQNASPAWTNIFRRVKLPETIQLSTSDGQVEKSYQLIGEDMTEVIISFTFKYPYDAFPDEIALFINSEFQEKKPHVNLVWMTPDGREVNLDSFALEPKTHYRLEQNQKLPRKLGGLEPNVGIFADPASEEPIPLKGTYTLEVSGILFEEGSDFDCEFVLYGKVYGLAGTDNHRRDLMIALLWGAPVALAFGLLGAVGTSLIAMAIAAVGAWYGGWVDSFIQRITEVNIILPTLPIAIMVFILYSRSIWTVLLVIVLLNIFGSSIKNYRAAFLQVRESAFIEGAIAYGAGGGRIISQYMIPRILPILLPQLVIMVPGFVFYEATLAYLGLSDPYLPTWGKVVHDALTNGAYLGYYYWILEPIGLLLLTGLAFALFGFALDRVVNPRLREI